MRPIVKLVGADTADLSAEERNSFSVAYKNKLDHLRKSWRALTSKQQEQGQFEEEMVRQYVTKIEMEIKTLCVELQGMLENRLIPAAKGAESKVFYYKMSGDANRYIAEISRKAERSEFGDRAKRAYETAGKIAAADLPPTHPCRLGLALNLSVFYYEIVNDADEACRVAKHAFDEGVAALDSLGEKAYRESTQILQLLCENLTLWNPDAPSVDGNYDESDEAEYA
jgi:14-3-3 protein epsilon